MQFKTKSNIIEAFQWTGDIDQEEDPIWAVAAIEAGRIHFYKDGKENVQMIIYTPQSWGISSMRATPGDWIIQGAKGELYPCKNDIFKATYEPTLSQSKQQLFTRDEVLAFANNLLDNYRQRAQGLVELPHPIDLSEQLRRDYLTGYVEALKQASAACCLSFGLKLQYPRPQQPPSYLDTPASLAGDPDARVVDHG